MRSFDKTGGQITATGERVSFTGMCMVRVEEGKIAEARNNYNFPLLYKQLGEQGLEV
jgi:ketosteroid isomerase-like protein